MTFALFSGPQGSKKDEKRGADGKVDKHAPVEAAYRDRQAADGYASDAMAQHWWKYKIEREINEISYNYGCQRALEVAQQHPTMF